MLAVGVLAGSQLLAGAEPAAAPTPAIAWAWTGDASGLHSLSMCELDDIYRRACVHNLPNGWYPGEVITFTNMPAPNMAKRLADRHWMGKHIEADGHFINQWRRRQALESDFVVGPSYVDGQPCLVFEYPRWTPLFGPMRDEYREIAPGLYLGRMYRRVPHVRFLGFNYLRLSESGCCTSVALCTPDAAPVAVEIPPAVSLLALREELSKSNRTPATVDAPTAIPLLTLRQELSKSNRTPTAVETPMAIRLLTIRQELSVADPTPAVLEAPAATVLPVARQESLIDLLTPPPLTPLPFPIRSADVRVNRPAAASNALWPAHWKP